MTTTPVVVAGWSGSTNLGDELIYTALARQLAVRGGAPVAISTDPARTVEVHGGEAISHAAPWAWWRAIGAADRLVFGGGGLLQEETSRWNVPYHLSRVAVARGSGARIVAVGLGGGRLQAPSRALVGRALDGVPIAARDRATYEQLTALGLDVRLTADLAFSLPPPSASPRDELVVCLRPRNVGSGWAPASRTWRLGLPTSAQVDALAATLGGLARGLGCSLRFVALQADRDGPLHDAIAERVRDVEVSSVRPSLATVADEIARGRVVIAMRFHAAVMAMLAARPVIGVAYSGKVTELAADAPNAVLLLDGPLTGLSPEMVASALGSSADARRTELDRLVTRELGNGTMLDELLAGVPSRRQS